MKLLEKLFRVPYINSDSSIDICPDGSQVAFSWNMNGSWEIFLAKINGTTKPVQITEGLGGKFNPSWSPDGKSLAYVQDLDGSESYHLHLINLENNESRDLTSSNNCPLHPHYDWSPDGTRLVFSTIEKGFYGLNILSISDKKFDCLCSFDQPIRDISWSPAGDLIAVEEESAGTDSSIVLVSVQSGNIVKLSFGGKVINAKNPSWSKDGVNLALSSDYYGFNNIGNYNIGSKLISWLSDGKTDDTQPTWSPSGDDIVYIQNKGTISKLIIRKPGKEPIRKTIGKGVYYSPKYLPDGENILVIYENPRHPPDLWMYSIIKDEFSQITNSLPEELRTFNFVMPDEIFYPGLDGENVPALIYRPHKNHNDIEQKRPAIVNIHGGPDWLYQSIWNPFMTYLSSKGWVVLAPNYRGSTGYGRNWQVASRYKMGFIDTEDIIAGAEFLIREGIANPARLIVTGRSHGGYLTMMCLIKRPELWAGGSAVVPFLNLFSSHEECRQDLQHWNIENYGDPIENHDRWVAGSPYFFLDSIKAPVQLICSENDIRCPASDAIASHKKLQELGLKSELIVFSDEGHQLLKIGNVIKSYQNQLEFFIQVLGEN